MIVHLKSRSAFMDWLRFIHLKPFDRKWTDLGLDDDDLQVLQNMIMAGPDQFPVVRDTGGLRKIRFGRRGKGKKGGFRVGFAYFPDNQIALLITVYAKNEQSDLSAADRRAVAQIIGLIKQQLQQEVIR